MISPFEIASYEVEETRMSNRFLLSRTIHKYYSEADCFGCWKTRQFLKTAYDIIYIIRNARFFRAFNKDGVRCEYSEGYYR